MSWVVLQLYRLKIIRSETKRYRYFWVSSSRPALGVGGVHERIDAVLLHACVDNFFGLVDLCFGRCVFFCAGSASRRAILEPGEIN